MTEFTQIATYLAGIFNQYIKKYTISNTEFVTGGNRGSLPIYGVEYTLEDTLPNNSSITQAIDGYSLAYTYWIDLSASYAKNSITKDVVPLVGDGLSISITDGDIVISSSDDKTAYDVVKVVLNYTKG